MKNIEISIETARALIPCLETKIEIEREEIARAECAVQQHTDAEAALTAQLAEIKARISTAETEINSLERLPKGHGEKLIQDALAALPEGEGITMAEICKRTGVNHSTVFRTLNEPKRNKGRFVNTGKLWSLKR